MGGIDEDAGVLRCDDRLDYGGKVVDVGQCFYTKEDIVKRAFDLVRRFFWTPDDCYCGQQRSSSLRELCGGSFTDLVEA